MHAMILAGGRGQRLSELTHATPKGLLKVGDWTLLDLIVHHLATNGVDKVSIAGGFKVEQIQQHFAQTGAAIPVDVVDTGSDTNTAGRIKRLLEHDNDVDQACILCWSDGLSNIDFKAMLKQHAGQRCLVTLGAVHPPARFGELQIELGRVTSYSEKAAQLERWVSGGYFIIDPNVIDQIAGDNSSWEHDVLPSLVANCELAAYQHAGAWQCMDTLYEHELLNYLHASGQAFWPVPGA